MERTRWILSCLQIGAWGVAVVFRPAPPAEHLAFTKAATTDVEGKREDVLARPRRGRQS